MNSQAGWGEIPATARVGVVLATPDALGLERQSQRATQRELISMSRPEHSGITSHCGSGLRRLFERDKPRDVAPPTFGNRHE